MKPRIGARKRPQAADEQSGGDEEEHGAGDLGDRERGAQRRGDGAAGSARAGIERAFEPRAGSLGYRCETETAAGHDCKPSGEEQRAPAHVGLHQARCVGRQDQLEDRQSFRGNQHPGDRAKERENDALGQQLLRDAPRRRPESGSNADLAAAGRGPGQAEIGDVRARDHEHGGHCGEHDQESGLHVADERFVERDGRDVLVPVGGHLPWKPRADS